MSQFLYFAISVLISSTIYSQVTPIFQHNFDGTKNSNGFTLGDNLTLNPDKFMNPNNAVFLPDNHENLFLDYSSEANNLNNGTISFWYKNNTITGGNPISNNYPIFYINNGGSSYNEAIILALNTNMLVFGSSTTIGGNTTNINFVNNTTNNSNWQFYTITYNTNAKKLSLYINGTLAVTKDFYGLTNSLDKKMHFAGWATDSNIHSSTSGWFDNIKVYSSDLDATEILDLYTNENVPINYNLTTLYEHTFTNTKAKTNFIVGENLTLTNDKFNNSNNAIYLPNNHDKLKLNYDSNKQTLQQQGTISFWFKLDDKIENPIGSTYPIFYISNGASSYHEGIMLGIDPSSGNYKFGNSNNTTSYISALNKSYDNNWHYYTISYFESTLSLYIDGTHITNKTFFPLLKPTAQRFMHFGGWNASTTPHSEIFDKSSLYGNFDNIIVHDRFLEAATAANLYQNEIDTYGLNIQEIDKGKGHYAYPNPVKDFLYIVSESNIKNIAVYNTIGQLQNVKLDFNKINLSNIKSGTYFININLSDNTTMNIKVIKQ